MTLCINRHSDQPLPLEADEAETGPGQWVCAEPNSEDWACSSFQAGLKLLLIHGGLRKKLFDLASKAAGTGGSWLCGSSSFVHAAWMIRAGVHA